METQESFPGVDLKQAGPSMAPPKRQGNCPAADKTVA